MDYDVASVTLVKMTEYTESSRSEHLCNGDYEIKMSRKTLGGAHRSVNGECIRVIAQRENLFLSFSKILQKKKILQNLLNERVQF